MSTEAAVKRRRSGDKFNSLFLSCLNSLFHPRSRFYHLVSFELRKNFLFFCPFFLALTWILNHGGPFLSNTGVVCKNGCKWQGRQKKPGLFPFWAHNASVMIIIFLSVEVLARVRSWQKKKRMRSSQVCKQSLLFSTSIFTTKARPWWW